MCFFYPPERTPLIWKKNKKSHIYSKSFGTPYKNTCIKSTTAKNKRKPQLFIRKISEKRK